VCQLTRIPKLRNRARAYLLGFCVENGSDVPAIILFCHCDAETSRHSRTKHLRWSVKVLEKFYSQFFRGRSLLLSEGRGFKRWAVTD
jgi:hypothetical protein